MSLGRYYAIKNSQPVLSDWLTSTRGKWILIFSHALVGFLSQKGDDYIKYYSFIVMFVGTYQIIKTKNKYGAAHMFTAYMLGLEIFLRMTKSNIFWEFGKYSCAYFMILGLLSQRIFKKRTFGFLMYFYLLIPGIFLSDPEFANQSWRKLVSLNLSGPLTLCVSSIYFYKREFNFESFSKMCFILTLPLSMTIAYLLKNITNLENIEFSLQSNFQLSAGFGPNQISTILGFGICIIFCIKLLRISIFNLGWLEWAFAILCLIFALLTFSRGGMVSALITCSFGFVLFQWGHRRKKLFYQIFFTMILFITAIYQTFQALDNFSEGFLVQRYSLTEQSTDKILSGRGTIIKLEKKIFDDNFLLGVGVGMSPYVRKEYSGRKKLNSHTEFSRMLAEHGSFGLVALIIMLYIPLTHFMKIKSTETRIIFVIFICYSLLTISHSAMRIALPGIIYGMAFLKLNKET